jgi:protein TonB
MRGVDPSLNNEVLRALKAAPKWTPGMQRGKPVNVSMSMPVKFILQ